MMNDLNSGTRKSYNSRSSIRSTTGNYNGIAKTSTLLVLFQLLLLSLSYSNVVHALFEDEVGLFDVAIETTGHCGPVDYIHIINNPSTTNSGNSASNNQTLMISSDNGPTISLLSDKNNDVSSSCYVACRYVTTGTIVWRRNVCATNTGTGTGTGGAHIALVTTNEQYVITYDIHMNIIRSWTITTGTLVWETYNNNIDTNKDKSVALWNMNDTHIAINTVVSINIQSGEMSNSIIGKPPSELLTDNGSTSIGRGTHTVMSLSNTDTTNELIVISAVIDYSDSTSSKNRKNTNNNKNIYSYPTNIKFIYSIQNVNNNNNNNGSNNKLEGTLIENWLTENIIQEFLSMDTKSNNNDYIHSLHIISDSVISSTSSTTVSNGSRNISFNVLITTYRGSTKLFTIHVSSLSNNSVTTGNTVVVWYVEESLGCIDSVSNSNSKLKLSSTTALILDASHISSNIKSTSTKNTNVIVSKDHTSLQFTNRLEAQLETIVSIYNTILNIFSTTTKDTTSTSTSTSTTKHQNHRDSKFGLIKVIIFLTSTKIIAIDTKTPNSNYNINSNINRIRYTIDLPTTLYPTVSTTTSNNIINYQHKLIHGSINTNIAKHGINGGGRTRDVLVISYPITTLHTNTNINTNDNNDYYDYEIKFLCFDGTTGLIHTSGTIPYLLTQQKKVIQIIPIASTSSTSSRTSTNDEEETTTKSYTGNCQQNALLVLNDYTILSVLDSYNSEKIITKYLSNNNNNNNVGGVVPSSSSFLSLAAASLYSHYVDTTKSKVVSLAVVSSSTNDSEKSSSSSSTSSSHAIPVGSTTFHDETIVKVVYPNRFEIIQSPCNILGDEGLLLKYINPHMMVIATTAKEKKEVMAESDSNDNHQRMTSAIREATYNKASINEYNTKKKETTVSKLQQQQQQTQQKRKPLGVTTDSNDEVNNIDTNDSTKRRLQQQQQSSPSTSSDEPTLFINIVDTVSGRILYRIGHSNVVITGTTNPVNLLISENWIYYTYFNERTRRTELSVLSLYEGMINPKGLSAFTVPSSITSTKFSSLDSTESTPVVLSKVYTIPKSVTSLGITSSRGGISVKRLLVATGDGQIYQIDRKLLEPRRPVGQLKDSEKKEGLVQYSEYIPFIPLMAVTYNLSIYDVRTILTSATDLESQTIVVAYGGPTIYITRVSPSRGFDLLPDSFNKILLSIVVIVLIIIVFITHRMGTKKILKFGWI